jgi:hypothetical protein
MCFIDSSRNLFSESFPQVVDAERSFIQYVVVVHVNWGANGSFKKPGMTTNRNIGKDMFVYLAIIAKLWQWKRN